MIFYNMTEFPSSNNIKYAVTYVELDFNNLKFPRVEG
jgi:hypothetical protein